MKTLPKIEGNILNYLKLPNGKIAYGFLVPEGTYEIMPIQFCVKDSMFPDDQLWPLYAVEIRRFYESNPNRIKSFLLSGPFTFFNVKTNKTRTYTFCESEFEGFTKASDYVEYINDFRIHKDKLMTVDSMLVTDAEGDLREQFETITLELIDKELDKLYKIMSSSFFSKNDKFVLSKDDFKKSIKF